jgi:hypothetical protein
LYFGLSVIKKKRGRRAVDVEQLCFIGVRDHQIETPLCQACWDSEPLYRGNSLIRNSHPPRITIGP